MKDAPLLTPEELAARKKKFKSHLIVVVLPPIYTAIAVIQVETGLTLYSAINALFHNNELAALSAVVFVVLDLGLIVLGTLNGWLYKTALAAWLAANALILGTQINSQPLVEDYYRARVEQYVRAVFDDRMSERTAVIDICKATRRKSCDSLMDEPDPIMSRPPLRSADGEPVFQYLVRVYNQAFAAECRVPSHVSKFDELRQADPREPRRDPFALLIYVFADFPSCASIASVAFALVVWGLHVFGILVAEKLIVASRSGNLV